MNARLAALAFRWIAALCASLACLVAPVAAAAPDVAPDACAKSIDEVLAVIRTDRISYRQPRNPRPVEEKVLPPRLQSHDATAVGRNGPILRRAEGVAGARIPHAARSTNHFPSQYRNQTIDVKPAKVGAGDTDTLVKTLVNQPGGQPIPIDYSMEKSDKGWRVYDVVVDGVSLVTTYRSVQRPDQKAASWL
jgi:phospholipid transport system substrate-binding protein